MCLESPAGGRPRESPLADVLGIDAGGVPRDCRWLMCSESTLAVTSGNHCWLMCLVYDAGPAGSLRLMCSECRRLMSLLAGPVDSIDRTNGVFESMGQVVMASQSMLAGMHVGDYVSVGGSIVAPGWLYADDVFVSDELYVPGATEVFVSGMLTSVNSRNGTARMGDLTIDYTPSLGSVEAPSRAMWSFRGIMPSKRGVMISERSEPR